MKILEIAKNKMMKRKIMILDYKEAEKVFKMSLENLKMNLMTLPKKGATNQNKKIKVIR